MMFTEQALIAHMNKNVESAQQLADLAVDAALSLRRTSPSGKETAEAALTAVQTLAITNDLIATALMDNREEPEECPGCPGCKPTLN